MGPKKEVAEKEREKVKPVPSLDDPINSKVWKCVVVLAVERSSYDVLVLKEFITEANKGHRQEVKSINFDSFVLKILNDFLNGGLSSKYVFLLNFTSVLQEAAEFVKSKMDIPIPLLVKVVKALLFLLREESIVNIEKKSLGPPDPIKIMAERPSVALGVADNKMKPNAPKKEQTTAGKKANVTGEGGIRIKPPSATKQDTKLLKRGEGAKEDEYIDDAPLDGFNLHILLTGFYHPDFPLELIKAGIPLHGLLCIDMSLSSGNRFTPSTHSLLQKLEANSESIQNFWDAFLKILWDPTLNIYFKDVIFQVYSPQKPLCGDTKLNEFIYKELSYLMYDISDFKRQHNNYLSHVKLWNVNMKESDKVQEREEVKISKEHLPSECITVPVVVQYMLNVICSGEENYFYGPQGVSFDSIDSDTMESDTPKSFVSPSVLAKYSSSLVALDWNNVINQSGDFNTLSVFMKTKELDVKYGIYERNYWIETSSGKDTADKTGSQTQICYPRRQRILSENLEDALNPEWSVFKSFWKNIAEKEKPFCLDYCIYLLLMTKVLCSYQVKVPVPASYKHSLQSNSSSKKRFKFKRIEKVNQEMQNPHFSVTNCSRNVLKFIPYNIKELNRDFFCPSQLKIVSPGKLKATSAPEFRKLPPINTEISFLSDFIIPDEILQNLEFDVFENLRDFIEEDMLSRLNGFDFVEELSKEKLLAKERDILDDYNCIDHFYSVLTDSIFVILHNRKDSSNTYHETFNEALRTAIGLRDFFEYVLEDECSWLESEEKIYQSKLSQIGKDLEQNADLKNYSDSDFWMDTSIKYQEYLKLTAAPQKDVKEGKPVKKVDIEKGSKDTKKARNTGKGVKKGTSEGPTEFSSLSKSESTVVKADESYAFEGYDVSDVAVQFSGLKTVYHAGDCSIAVELIERLYGNQDLGIHIRQGSHTLHLYSYVCPEPHVLDPYTCHLFYKNGIVVAFGKRFVETFDLVEEEIVESKTVVSKGKRNSSEASTTKKTKRVRKVSKRVEDGQFSYDMRLSMPNGLAITVVRKVVDPCYIKQWFLTKLHSHSEKPTGERKRLFLPNGNVIKIMEDDSVEILGVDASIVTSSLNHLSYNAEEKIEGTEHDSALSFTKYTVTTSEGLVKVVDEGKTISSRKMEVFVNRDAQTNTTFYRRMDGTNYLKNDKTLCVQFKDGTKLSNSILVKRKVNLTRLGNDEDVDKINGENGSARIYNKVIMEHPDYATVMYNSQEGEWEILLPFDSTIKVESTGNYKVDIDSQTELKIDRNVISMNRFSAEHELLCQATADLTVFEKEGKEIYCQMKDSSGKTFVVEPNSNCYVLSSEEVNGTITNTSTSTREFEGQEPPQESKESTESSQSQFVALDDLASVSAVTDTTRKEERNGLSPENKYLVVRRDMSGFELLHRGDVMKALKEIKKGSIVFSQEIPGSEKLRCFVLIGPAPKVKCGLRKWEVESILPEPKFVPGRFRPTESSLYGNPPSWMHPFPKRKRPFEVPEKLTCRVFIETNRSEFCPELGSLESCFFELGNLPEIKHSKIKPGLRNVLNHMKRLSNDDQDMLKEMYALTAGQILSMKKLKPLNTEKLNRYLALSKYCTELQMYHKKSIRYHLVPSYFYHPAGFSWLILNELTLALDTKEKQVAPPPPSPSPSEFTSIFSNEEIEYNLTVSAKQSYSDLSCRTDITMFTAPMILTRGNICTCKIKPVRGTVSAPATKVRESDVSEQDGKTYEQSVCAFREDEIKTLEQVNYEHLKSSATLTIRDLISLGLV